jgi:hypothetical protein
MPVIKTNFQTKETRKRAESKQNKGNNTKAEVKNLRTEEKYN